jgi:bacterioferritin (cytochrome b1)
MRGNGEALELLNDLLLTKILVAEQDDTQWLESQLELILHAGEPNYLAQQINS